MDEEGKSRNWLGRGWHEEAGVKRELASSHLQKGHFLFLEEVEANCRFFDKRKPPFAISKLLPVFVFF